MRFFHGICGRKKPKGRHFLAGLEQIPPKSPDFGAEDLLQYIDFARLLFGEASPLRRDARSNSSMASADYGAGKGFGLSDKVRR